MGVRRHLGLGGLVLLAGLCACSRPQTVGGSPAGDGGRYAGFGVYAADEGWRRLAGPEPVSDKPADGAPAAATIKDDDVVLVTIDTHSGEVRQCGAVSGYCVAMNPWSRPPGQSAPAMLRPATTDEGKAAPAGP